MSHYRHLSIWKAALSLAVHLEGAVRRFSRYLKYTLGQELRGAAQHLCRMVTRANSAHGATRLHALDELVLAVEDMKTLITLAQETQAFAHFNEFALADEWAVDLGKQSGGWRVRSGPLLTPTFRCYSPTFIPTLNETPPCVPYIPITPHAIPVSLSVPPWLCLLCQLRPAGQRSPSMQAMAPLLTPPAWCGTNALTV
jgi:hypothetical protein